MLVTRRGGGLRWVLKGGFFLREMLMMLVGEWIECRRYILRGWI